MRAVFLTLVLLGLSGMSVLANDAFAGQSAKRPNILFFLVDDLGVTDIGAYNPDTFYETPNVDRLAKSGTRFTQGYAACCVCSPTRFSIMTGKFPVRSGITNFLAGTRSERFEPAPLNLYMPLEEVTLGEAFHDAGYRTALLGKWHLGDMREFGPQLQGFDVVSGDIRHVAPTVANLELPDHPNQGPQDDPYFIQTRTTNVTDDALLVLEAFKDEPFLIYLSFYQVHVPLGASGEYVDPYRAKKERLGLQDNETLDFIEEEQVHISDQPRLSRIRQNHAVYAGMVSHTDACVGRVLAKLDELALTENTIVVFVSDNGGLSTAEGSPTSNVPFRSGKGWLYEGGHRVAYIIRTPNGSLLESDIPVTTTDFYPTLLDLACLPQKPGQHIDGVSLKPLLDGTQQALDRESLFWHYPHYSNQGGFPGGAIRTGDWKLIRRYEDGRTHLYNLVADPSERHDLADVESERTRTMASALDHWLESTGAKFLEPKDGRTPWRPDYLK